LKRKDDADFVARPAALGPKRGARIIAPKKQKLIAQKKLLKASFGHSFLDISTQSWLILFVEAHSWTHCTHGEEFGGKGRTS
jgi:hypothetical protein